MAKSKTLLALLLAVTLALGGCGTDPKPAPSSKPLSFTTFEFFDTVTYIYDYSGNGKEAFDQKCAEVTELLGKYHQLLDIYHEYPGVNNLYILNEQAGKDPVAVSEELLDFLEYALDLTEKTGGKMNVMLGPVLTIWHQYREQRSGVPSAEELEAASQHCSPSLLEIDRQKGTARISDPQGRIDAGALGKGYAAEKAAQLLETEGCDGYVLNLGGNLRAIGAKPDGSSWTTGVTNPFDPSGEFPVRVYMQDISCVTSGNYERYYEVEGVRYHHIIDPDTLYPADYFVSVTVLCHDSALADALSTALFCMNQEDGEKLVKTMEEPVEVIWIAADGKVTYTPQTEARIVH